MPADEPAEIYAAKDTTEAYFVRNLLADAGVEATIVGEALRGVMGEVPFQIAGPRVWVRTGDLDRAQPVIEQYKRHLAEQAHGDPTGEVGLGGSESDEDEQEFCYHCGQPIDQGESPCPVCGGKIEWGTGTDPAGETT